MYKNLLYLFEEYIIYPHNFLIKAFLLLFLFTETLPAQYALSGLPGEIIPASVGVNTHFITGHTKDLDMIADAGIKIIRQDLIWSMTEKIKGEYDWSAYDTLLAEMNQRGIRPIFTLSYNNPLYTNEVLQSGPQDSENIKGYANWTGAAAKHFKGHNIIWEIWNEPNAVPFWKPVPNADQYINMALASCNAIRKADPNALIIAPALAMFNWNFSGNISNDERGIRGQFTIDFMKKLFKSGMLDYLCAISVHAYRDGPPQSPETIESEYCGFRKLIAEYAPKYKNIPVISGEWGYTTCNCVEGVMPQTQANWAARMQLFNLYLGIPVTIWYDWKNDGTDVTVRGQNRGLVTNNLELKPSYISIYVMTHELSGYKITGRYYDGNASDFILILKNSKGNIKLAAWTQNTSHKANIPLTELSSSKSINNIWWVDGSTNSGKVNVSAQSFMIELNNTPKYCSTVMPAQLPEFKIKTN